MTSLDYNYQLSVFVHCFQGMTGDLFQVRCSCLFLRLLL